MTLILTKWLQLLFTYFVMFCQLKTTVYHAHHKANAQLCSLCIHSETERICQDFFCLTQMQNSNVHMPIKNCCKVILSLDDIICSVHKRGGEPSIASRVSKLVSHLHPHYHIAKEMSSVSRCPEDLYKKMSTVFNISLMTVSVLPEARGNCKFITTRLHYN